MAVSPQDPLARLILCLGKLPGVGRRTAERMAMRLVRGKDGLLRELTEALRDAEANVTACNLCGSLTAQKQNPCRLCTSPGRDDSLLCIVDDPSDILVIERSGGYVGRYHALMGKVSPMRGNGPGDLRVQELLVRLSQSQVTEIILALGTDAEGETTASYLTELLSNKPLTISRLASGIPFGSAIGYSDPVTVARAFRARTTPGG